MRQVQLNNRQYRDIIADCWRGIADINDPPSVFSRGELPTRIVCGTDGPKLDILNPDKMFGVLINACDFVTITKTGCTPTKPTQEIAKTMVVVPDVSLPVLDGMSSTPLFAPTGRLITANGYDKELRTWFHGMEKLNVANKDCGIADAVGIIRNVFCDFPLAKETEFVHILATLLCPFVRKLIKGTTPVHLIEANSAGGGKTLIAKAIHLIATGENLATQSASEREEEMRKNITAQLVEGKGIIVLDNLNHGLNSGVFASAITAERWSDRLLGFTKVVTLPNTATWIITANNPKLSLEVARRCIRVRLVAEGEKPWMRQTESYSHPDLLGWISQQRGEIVGAIKRLVTNWFDKGCPPPPKGWNLGSFEEWSRVVGGIIYSAGLEGFLASNEDLYSQCDTEGAEWQMFVEKWWEEKGNLWCQASDLAILADQNDLIPSVLGDGLERSRRIRVGFALVKRRDTWIGKYKIEQRKNDKAKTTEYRLMPKEELCGKQSSLTFDTASQEDAAKKTSN